MTKILCSNMFQFLRLWLPLQAEASRVQHISEYSWPMSIPRHLNFITNITCRSKNPQKLHGITKNITFLFTTMPIVVTK